MISSAARAVARWISPFLAIAAVTGADCSADPAEDAPDTAQEASEQDAPEQEAPEQEAEARELPDVAARLANGENPLVGQPLYVNPTSAASRAANSANPPSPELSAIANTPQAFWIDEAVPGWVVNGYLDGARAAGELPVLAIYAIPHRDCGSFAAGGFATGADYRGWIDGVAGSIGSSPVVIVLEPDALDMADCLSPDQRQERFDLIRYAVDTLTRNPAAAVYIDGGNSRWKSAEEIASRLNQVGIEHARGFSLNTSNFFTTEEEIGYGEEVSALTNGSHYVIDTGRNGAGPAPESPLSWCNPGGRALGAAPTTETAGEHADAYLWVKRPGESDGACNSGNPRAGVFVNQYAIELAHNAGQ
ncbi:glycoside hydrolase family 6 protein [Segniliparus rugosus]|uniref:glycoside hydrolase family 6 protein n=1 Tax=Segniliparus rugosus TaxID=286804 RepID=UPI0002DD8C82|nr:glycoside hydrolase family 6 protein [Segniliparus rugosus]